MSLAVKITTDSDTATPWLAGIRERLSPHRMAAEIGPRCQRLVQRNFRSLGTNKKGWPTTEFYNRAADATTWQEGFGFVMIGTNQLGVRQRLMGGVIKPVNKKYLTIPARAEAYGKTAREFPGLKFAFVLDPASGRMRPALVGNTGVGSIVGRKRGGKSKPIATIVGREALFWLAKGVKQKPDPRVMPSDEAFEAEFDKSMDVLLRDLAKGGVS